MKIDATSFLQGFLIGILIQPIAFFLIKRYLLNSTKAKDVMPKNRVMKEISYKTYINLK